MAIITIAVALARATGGFRLKVPTASARRALTQNILMRAVSGGTPFTSVGLAEAAFRRAGIGIRSSDFTKIFNSVVGRQSLSIGQKRVLDRQAVVPLDSIPTLRDVPTLRQTGVSKFVVRAQVELTNPQTGTKSRSWITINTDHRLNAQQVQNSIPDFGFASGSEQLVLGGQVITLQTFRRSPSTTIII